MAKKVGFRIYNCVGNSNRYVHFGNKKPVSCCSHRYFYIR